VVRGKKDPSQEVGHEEGFSLSVRKRVRFPSWQGEGKDSLLPLPEALPAYAGGKTGYVPTMIKEADDGVRKEHHFNYNPTISDHLRGEKQSAYPAALLSQYTHFPYPPL
jgi:hypothetical protein